MQTQEHNRVLKSFFLLFYFITDHCPDCVWQLKGFSFLHFANVSLMAFLIKMKVYCHFLLIEVFYYILSGGEKNSFRDLKTFSVNMVRLRFGTDADWHWWEVLEHPYKQFKDFLFQSLKVFILPMSASASDVPSFHSRLLLNELFLLAVVCQMFSGLSLSPLSLFFGFFRDKWGSILFDCMH